MSDTFVDTNVWIYYFDDQSSHYQHSLDLLAELTLKPQNQLVISPYVINELYYYYSKKLDNTKAQRLIQKVLDFPRLKLADIKLNNRDMNQFMNITKNYQLKAFDAFHVLYCKKLKIMKIASFDTDFDRVSWLRRL